ASIRLSLRANSRPRTRYERSIRSGSRYARCSDFSSGRYSTASESKTIAKGVALNTTPNSRTPNFLTSVKARPLLVSMILRSSSKYCPMREEDDSKLPFSCLSSSNNLDKTSGADAASLGCSPLPVGSAADEIPEEKQSVETKIQKPNARDRIN